MTEFLTCPWKKRQIGFLRSDGSLCVTNPNVDIMQDRTGSGCLFPIATNVSEEVADHIISLHNQSLLKATGQEMAVPSGDLNVGD